MYKFFRSLCSHNVTFVTFAMSVITLVVLKQTFYNDQMQRRRYGYAENDYVDAPNAPNPDAVRWSKEAEESQKAIEIPNKETYRQEIHNVEPNQPAERVKVVESIRDEPPERDTVVAKVSESGVENPVFDWVSARLARKESMLGRKFDHSTNCTKVLPQVIMIGVMKCGTEALSTFLAVHPDIALQMRVQTVLFFNVHYDEGLEWYRNQMPCSEKGQLTMEKSPQYFPSAGVPQRIHDMNSSIKLIVIMREPISRAVSHYTHVNSIKPGSFGKTFEKTVLDPLGKINERHEVITKSLYSVHLKQWLQYFKLDQIHIVDGDNYKEHPAEELQKIEKFLGIRNYITDDLFSYNKEKGFFCLMSEGTEHCMPAGKGRTHPNVKPDVLEMLQAFFKPYNEELFRMIGRRFDWDY